MNQGSNSLARVAAWNDYSLGTSKRLIMLNFAYLLARISKFFQGIIYFINSSFHPRLRHITGGVVRHGRRGRRAAGYYLSVSSQKAAFLSEGSRERAFSNIRFASDRSPRPR